MCFSIIETVATLAVSCILQVGTAIAAGYMLAKAAYQETTGKNLFGREISNEEKRDGWKDALISGAGFGAAKLLSGATKFANASARTKKIAKTSGKAMELTSKYGNEVSSSAKNAYRIATSENKQATEIFTSSDKQGAITKFAQARATSYLMKKVVGKTVSGINAVRNTYKAGQLKVKTC